MTAFVRKYGQYMAFAVALAALLGSLYASEILRIEPCVLCWYQRIFMYPLVIILTVGILRRDKAVAYYVLPFSFGGGAVALYHYFLYTDVISEKLAPCTTGVSCTQKLPELFGFINVISLSLTAFIAITLLMLMYRTSHENE